MRRVVEILLSPIAFALGFLWPLTAQTLLATGTVAEPMNAYLVAIAVLTPFAIMAQVRGSWLWVKA